MVRLSRHGVCYTIRTGKFRCDNICMVFGATLIRCYTSQFARHDLENRYTADDSRRATRDHNMLVVFRSAENPQSTNRIIKDI